MTDISFLFLLRMGDGQFLITAATWYHHMQSYAIKRLNFQNCMRWDIERSIAIWKFTSRQTAKHRYDSTSTTVVTRIWTNSSDISILNFLSHEEVFCACTRVCVCAHVHVCMCIFGWEGLINMWILFVNKHSLSRVFIYSLNCLNLLEVGLFSVMYTLLNNSIWPADFRTMCNTILVGRVTLYFE